MRLILDMIDDFTKPKRPISKPIMAANSMQDRMRKYYPEVRNFVPYRDKESSIIVANITQHCAYYETEPDQILRELDSSSSESLSKSWSQYVTNFNAKKQDIGGNNYER